MTPETRDAALEGLRFEVKALKPGQRVGYWKLMDQFDGGDAALSQLLDGELHKLEASGELVFVEDDIERRESSTAVSASRVRVKPKKGATKKKKVPAKKKKAPAKAKSKSKSTKRK